MDYWLALWNVLGWGALALLVLIFVYVLVRGASFAYFRTRLEYLREAMKVMQQGDK